MAEMIVEPLAPAAPMAPPVEPTAPADKLPPAEEKVAGKLSKTLLEVPAMQAIFAGQPAAFSASLEEFKNRPEAKTLIDHKDDLMKAGFGLYRSLDGQQGVIFNQLHIHGDEIKAADAEGRLAEVAPSFDEVTAAVSDAGGAHPSLNNAGVPAGFKAGPAPVPPMASPAAAGPTQPASAQKALANARSKNLSPGAPTSGAQPGAGRLLNSILKPVL